MTDRWSPEHRRKALQDPLRSLGGLHEAGRLKRGVAEFLRIPLLVTVGFALLGILTAVLDARLTGPVRDAAAFLVPPDGATDFVSAVATSLMTVTSITFTVLLLAVQQTASSLTPVVFDQYLRRRSNQLYFGFFVGVTAYSFLVLGLARSDPKPVIGAAITLLFAVVALVSLLMIVHSTIDQMRPQSVVRSIHELALRAREDELRMLGRVRAGQESPADAPKRLVRSLDSGYVVSVNVDRLAEVVRRHPEADEIMVDGRLGQYLIFGEPIATIIGLDPDDDDLDDEVLKAFGLDDIRDVDVESGYAVDQLENIAWSSVTSASQSPNTGITAIRALRDLLGRWLISGERDRSERSDTDEDLPIVYVDGAAERAITSLATLVVASAESRQTQSCAEILKAFSSIAPRLESRSERDLFQQCIVSVMPSVIQQAELPPLTDALEELAEVMDDEGFDPAKVRETVGLLREATRRLLPKPSDEPDAAHPQ